MNRSQAPKRLDVPFPASRDKLQILISRPGFIYLMRHFKQAVCSPFSILPLHVRAVSRVLGVGGYIICLDVGVLVWRCNGRRIFVILRVGVLPGVDNSVFRFTQL